MMYFTSDHHFFHENIIKLTNRPFTSLDQMHETLIKNWNSMVTDEDIVIVVGDFIFRQGSFRQWKTVLDQLNRKSLIWLLGNHDPKQYNYCIKLGANLACNELTLKIANEKVAVSHYPYQPSWFKKQIIRYTNSRYYDSLHKRPVNHGQFLIHGHTHSTRQVNQNMINVCVDAWDFYPVSVNQIATLIQQIKEGKYNEGNSRI